MTSIATRNVVSSNASSTKSGTFAALQQDCRLVPRLRAIAAFIAEAIADLLAVWKRFAGSMRPFRLA
jgi:hypothetical protein